MDLLRPAGLAGESRVSCVNAALAEEQAALREQLQTLWQSHHVGLEKTLDERFRDLAARIEAEVRTALASEMERATRAARCQARREASEEFNRAVRRLRHHHTADEWAAALLDATTGVASRAAVFERNRDAVKCLRLRGEGTLVEFALSSAPAFANAVEAREPVVAVRSPGELALAATMFGDSPEGKAFLFPIVAGDGVAALLYAEGDDAVDVSGLELLAGLAAAALECRRLAPAGAAPVVRIEETPGAGTRPPSGLAQLTASDRELHLRAQRFARVEVAEMRLYQPDAVRSGRARRDLYAALRTDIDAGRERFRREFILPCATMVDYFHWELVRTLAHDDAGLLGRSYPGPLV